MNHDQKKVSSINRRNFFLLLDKKKQYVKNMVSIFLMYLFKLLPVKRNKIFFTSYYGNQYGCNPKYISEYIIEKYPEKTFDIVWSFNDLNDKTHLSGIRKVKTQSLKYFYELCTSKVFITNYRTTEQYVKRKNQFYIQTWHSSLRLKQIEKDAEESLPADYVKMAQRDSQKCDLLLSGCRFSTETFKRSFWYKGEIFECGTPRNDVFFQGTDLLKQNVCGQLNIPLQSKIVLFAPTFRKDESLDIYNIDYKKVLDSLIHRFEGEWKFLVKLHPHLISKSEKLVYGENVIDVTSYNDVQELLAVSDILISDYSSLMFDFGITKRPCFLYVPDLEDYTKNDRNLYFDINRLPFIIANTNNELVAKINDFKERPYISELNGFLESIGSYEDGNSSEKLVGKIYEICFNKKVRRKTYESKAV